MKPMGLNSTPFISYHDINTNETDLYGDAWGFDYQFHDVVSLLHQVQAVPGKRLIRRLIEQVRQQNQQIL